MVGRLVDFLDGVAALGLGYVAEVPVDTRVWPERPLTVVPRTRHVLAWLGWAGSGTTAGQPSAATTGGAPSPPIYHRDIDAQGW